MKALSQYNIKKWRCQGSFGHIDPNHLGKVDESPSNLRGESVDYESDFMIQCGPRSDVCPIAMIR
jgi:hypothetical protein